MEWIENATEEICQDVHDLDYKSIDKVKFILNKHFDRHGLFQIGKLECSKGDVLVVKCSYYGTPDGVEAMKAYFEKKLPGLTIIFLDSTTELSLLTYKDIKKIVDTEFPPNKSLEDVEKAEGN